MAKRRDQLIEQAKARQGGAEIKTFIKLKGFTLTLGDPVEVRDHRGRLKCIVSSLRGVARVAGLPQLVTETIKVEIEPSFGVAGELEALSRAGREFIDLVDAKAIAHQQSLNDDEFEREHGGEITLQKPRSAAKQANAGRTNANKALNRRQPSAMEEVLADEEAEQAQTATEEREPFEAGPVEKA